MFPKILTNSMVAKLKMAYNGRKTLEEITSWIFDKCGEEHAIEHLKLSEKSVEKAENLRTEGNKYYRQRNFEKALNMYNASIMVAPHPLLSEKELDVFCAMENEPKDEYSVPLVNPARYCDTMSRNGEALSKAYANRAAVMLELKQFDKCIESIDLALDYGYPEKLKSSLEERKQRCISAQKQAAGTTTNLRDEKTKISNVNGTVHEESVFLTNVSAKPTTPLNLQQSNPNYPALSVALNIEYKSDRGRGIYATEEIHPGDVLVVDEPFTIYLFKENLSTHCSSCGVMCLTPLPCPGCCKVVFCSKTCRIKSLAKDHWLECKILETTIDYGLESLSNCYKLFRTFSFKQIKAMHKEFRNDLKDPSRILGSNRNGRYLSSSYQAVFHLQEYIDKRPVENLLALSARMLNVARFLQLSERFFIDEVGNPVAVTRDDLIEVTYMMAVNCGKNYINASELPKKAGGAIYPTVTLINHSCFPCATRYSRNGHDVIIAMRPVAPGEEITIRYWETFDVKEKQHRRKTLEEFYHFTCNCEACAGNWPTMTHLPLMTFLCPKCRLPGSEIGLCNKCILQTIFRLQTPDLSDSSARCLEVMNALETFQTLYRSESRSSAIVDSVHFCKVIETIFKEFVMPCQVPLELMLWFEETVSDGSLWSLNEEKQS